MGFKDIGKHEPHTDSPKQAEARAAAVADLKAKEDAKVAKAAADREAAKKAAPKETKK